MEVASGLWVETMRLPLHHQHRMDMRSECVAKCHAFTLTLTPLHRLSRPRGVDVTLTPLAP
jgi:hypothetical protein